MLLNAQLARRRPQISPYTKSSYRTKRVRVYCVPWHMISRGHYSSNRIICYRFVLCSDSYGALLLRVLICRKVFTDFQNFIRISSIHKLYIVQLSQNSYINSASFSSGHHYILRQYLLLNFTFPIYRQTSHLRSPIDGFRYNRQNLQAKYKRKNYRKKFKIVSDVFKSLRGKWNETY